MSQNKNLPNFFKKLPQKPKFSSPLVQPNIKVIQEDQLIEVMRYEQYTSRSWYTMEEEIPSYNGWIYFHCLIFISNLNLSISPLS